MTEPVSSVPRERVFHPSGGESRVKQSETEATEIGSILKKYLEENVPVPTERSMYGDFSSGLDFHAALNRVREAEQAFAAVPAHIRAHVQNDAGSFLDMVFDPERRGELEELGLVEAHVPEAAAPSERPDPEAGPASAPPAGPVAGGE